jgi:Ion channel
MAVLAALAGGALVLLVLVETFEAVVLPRRVTRPYRLARVYYRAAWRGWSALAGLLPAGRRRESLLSVFGPLSMLTLFALWAVGLVAGFALLQCATDDGRSLGASFYLSGTTFTTLGYGDVTPKCPTARLLAVTEAGVGFGFLAIVIGYLPVFYQSFSRREVTISLLDARAGSPPSAGELLLRLPPGRGTVLGRFLEEAERWAAEVLESQLSYPVLSYYRSQHDNQSWLAALACALDASALLLTVVRGADRQQARLTFAMARHALVDLALVLRRPPVPPGDRLPDERLAKLLVSLRAAGVAVRDDEAARAKLAELRGLYEPFAAALAAYLHGARPPVWRVAERPDNWQTSAWMRQAAGLARLATDPRDDHFD